MSWEVVSCWIESHPGLASWVQAVGSIAAILAAIWIAHGDSIVRRRAESQARLDALNRAITVADSVGRRINGILKTARAFTIDIDLMRTITSDLEFSLQHLREVSRAPGVDSVIFTQIFSIQASIEALRHAAAFVVTNPDPNSEFVELIRETRKEIQDAFAKLNQLTRQ